ncbi:hypothetical protein D16iCDA_01970 [Pseudomonas seleniipraecipitans]|uniref:Uncharacterized protein n=1 Tax=Phytopseudomonas seleniipraecipitans TaxID=640205 RepID=A0ABY5J8W9_9GAMM|nr:hypothetical protein [Pseudomonas seleniipraecipitans]UUD64499.1 hypothetical protein D16iCDA_01970 [Pseudomonas seleniipraecipitans]
MQPLFSSNFLFYKEFSDQATPEVVRIIGRQIPRSTVYFRFHDEIDRRAIIKRMAEVKTGQGELVYVHLSKALHREAFPSSFPASSA